MNEDRLFDIEAFRKFCGEEAYLSTPADPLDPPPWGARLQTLYTMKQAKGPCTFPDSASCMYDYGPRGNPFVCRNPDHGPLNDQT